jgi:nitroreductase
MSTSVQPIKDALEIMEERHAVRAFEKGKTIPDADLRQILSSAGQAPSAWNLQHWKFLVIESDEQKQRLLPITFGQQQIVDCSAVVAVLGDLEANRNAEDVYGAAVSSGKTTEAVKNTLVEQIENAYRGNPQLARDEAIRNSALAAMQLMLAAKALGYDSVPMGGYDAAKLVEAFRIPERYIPVLLISIGTAAREARGSGRFELEQTVVRESF